MEKIEGSVRSEDAEVIGKIESILRKMREVVDKVYPHPVPYFRIRVPFNDDILLVELRRPVRVDFIFFPDFVGSAIIHTNLRHTAAKIRIVFDGGTVREVALLDRSEKPLFRDPIGDSLLPIMLLPERFQALKNSRMRSESGHGEKWFKEFVSTIDQLSQVNEVKQIDSLELLNREGRVEILNVIIPRPVKNLEELRAKLDMNEKTLILDLFFYQGRGFAECTFGEGGLKDLKIWSGIGVTEKRVRKYLTLLPDRIFDDVIRSVKQFLEAFPRPRYS